MAAAIVAALAAAIVAALAAASLAALAAASLAALAAAAASVIDITAQVEELDPWVAAMRSDASEGGNNPNVYTF